MPSPSIYPAGSHAPLSAVPFPTSLLQPPTSHNSPKDVILIFAHGVEGDLTAGSTRHFAEGYAEVAPVLCWTGTHSLTARIADFATLSATCTDYARVVFGGRSMGARAAVRAALESEQAEGERREANEGRERNARGTRGAVGGVEPESGRRSGMLGQILESASQDALVLVSWPLLAGKHGERREWERREKILLDLPVTVDVLFIIGTEDEQCPLEEFAGLRDGMRARSWMVEVRGADHRMEHGDERIDRSIRMMTGRVAAEWLRCRDENRRAGRVEWNKDGDGAIWSGWT